MAATFKVNKTRDFTVMSNNHLRNRKLSLKAKGLQSLMLSLPDNWNYTLNGLVTLSKDGRDGVIAALQELEDNGYLIRTQERIGGKFSHTVYTIYEIPNGIIITLHKFNKEIKQFGCLSEQSIEVITSNKVFQPLQPFVEDIDTLKTKIQELINTQSEDYTERSAETPCTEIPFTAKPFTENLTLSNTNKSKTNILNTQSINHSSNSTQQKRNVENSVENYDEAVESVKEQIEYDILRQKYSDSSQLDEIVSIMTEVMMSDKDITINGRKIPCSMIHNIYQKIDFDCIVYVIDSVYEYSKRKRISNIKGYLITALYNAPMTINTYYTAECNYDMENPNNNSNNN